MKKSTLVTCFVYFFYIKLFINSIYFFALLIKGRLDFSKYGPYYFISIIVTYLILSLHFKHYRVFAYVLSVSIISINLLIRYLDSVPSPSGFTFNLVLLNILLSLRRYYIFRSKSKTKYYCFKRSKKAKIKKIRKFKEIYHRFLMSKKAKFVKLRSEKKVI